MNKKNIILLSLILLPLMAVSQEFMLSISVNSRQVEGTDKKVFQTMQTALHEFVNTRSWTSYQYRPEERLKGSLMIFIESRSGDQFNGKINIALERPVYKSSYNTTLMNIQDNEFTFRYTEYEPLEFIENSYTSNLTGVISYYLYMMLGFDGDSFSPYGGSPYFEKARNIVNLAQGNKEFDNGWQPYQSTRNRYWLVENMLNSSYSTIRDGSYKYHIKGLDLMSENVDVGRAGITEFLESLQRVNRTKPGLYCIQVLLNSKRDELINIYKEAAPMDKTQAVNILKEVDPANASKYQGIIKQN